MRLHLTVVEETGMELQPTEETHQEDDDDDDDDHDNDDHDEESAKPQDQVRFSLALARQSLFAKMRRTLDWIMVTLTMS